MSLWTGYLVGHRRGGGGGEEVDKAQKKGCKEGVKPVNKRRKQFATTDFRIQGLRELISVKN